MTRSPSRTRTSRVTPDVNADALIGNGDGSIHPGACTTGPRADVFIEALAWLFAESCLVTCATAVVRTMTGIAWTSVSGAHARQLDHARIASALPMMIAGRMTRVPMRELGRGMFVVMAAPPLEEILLLSQAQVVRRAVDVLGHSFPASHDSAHVGRRLHRGVIPHQYLQRAALA